MPGEETVRFPGSLGSDLYGVIEYPYGTPRAWAIFAHCFSCSSETKAATRVSDQLALKGYGVLRFDFTGLGKSDGEFADTTFTTNLQDIVSAAEYLEREHHAPALLVGHSLGGAAVLAAAERIPSVKAVTTIGAPSSPDHVRHLFTGIPEDPESDRLNVHIGGRPFTIGADLLTDLADQPQRRRIADLDAALLILHSPDDEFVSLDNASKIYIAAQHPKSFVSLDGADHLLLRREDADYAASMIAPWAAKYLPPPIDEADVEEGHVKVGEYERPGFVHVASNGVNEWVLDEPVRVPGGTGVGPNPYDALLSGLGACTSMTMRMYAERKGWDYGATTVRLQHNRVHAKDCEDCENHTGRIDVIEREITMDPMLTAEQREALTRIADRCPVHATLTNEIVIRTEVQ